MALTMGASMLGEGFIGVRDLVHGLERRSAPEFGIMGDIGKAFIDPLLDISDPRRGTPQWRGKFIKDMIVLSGVCMGIGSTTAGNAAMYIADVEANLEHPRSGWDWMVGLSRGTNIGHSRSMGEWAKSLLPSG
jgi:hypothetical protein